MRLGYDNKNVINHKENIFIVPTIRHIAKKWHISSYIIYTLVYNEVKRMLVRNQINAIVLWTTKCKDIVSMDYNIFGAKHSKEYLTTFFLDIISCSWSVLFKDYNENSTIKLIKSII